VGKWEGPWVIESAIRTQDGVELKYAATLDDIPANIKHGRRQPPKWWHGNRGVAWTKSEVYACGQPPTAEMGRKGIVVLAWTKVKSNSAPCMVVGVPSMHSAVVESTIAPDMQ
jgi:hypothetical protein